MAMTPRPLNCLCSNDAANCTVCAARGREQWREFAEKNPGDTPGQLIEKAIAQDRADVVLGILQNTAIDINAVCDPLRYESSSPLMTALRAGNARIVALIAGQSRFDLARSLPRPRGLARRASRHAIAADAPRMRSSVNLFENP